MGELKAVLWDLDGTITNSGPIIRQTLHAVMLGQTGVDHPLDSFSKYVGPPLYESFLDLGVAETDLETFIGDYRSRYDEAMPTTPVFPGVLDVLDELSDAGLATSLATSKWESVAKEACRLLGIEGHIDIVCGADPNADRNHKHEVIAHALDSLEAAGALDPSNRLNEAELGTELSERDVRSDVVMIGDRDFDTYGAAVHGIRTILVDWGDGTDEEKAGAWKVATSPKHLLELLMSL